MTAYNCAPYISQAIKSILNQTYKNFEFLIIDDGSTDNTENLANNFSDSRIRYIKQKHLGRTKALNFGLKEAKYDWIALIDSDDIWYPRKIEIQLKQAPLNKNDILLSHAIYFKGEKIKYSLPVPSDRNILKKKFALHGHICNSSVIYNRMAILEIGGYNEELSNSEDYDLWLRIMNTFDFMVINEYLVYCRIIPNSLSKNNILETHNNIYQIQSHYYEDLYSHFDIKNCDEENELKGWREFFYGAPSKSRKFWKEVSKKLSVKVLIAFSLSYLPPSLIKNLKELNLRYRLVYLFYYNRFANNRKILKQLLYINPRR
jgi:glycosyltransferase involved in cell wall biosynthesis